MHTPEQLARQQIDALLTAAGWAIQDYSAYNPSAASGIALREVPLKSGRCDYLLLINRQPVGVIEAKRRPRALIQMAPDDGRRLSLIRVAEAQVDANLARAQRLRQSILQAAFSA